MPRWRKATVLAVVAAYLLAIAWQVAGHRDDWPLSSYPMFSHPFPSVAQRSRIVAVTDQGERDLNVPGLGSARQRVLLSKLGSNPKRLAKLLRQIREQAEAHLHTPIQAIRSYKEAWRVRPDMKGIDHPSRKITVAIFLPPDALLERLQAEGKGTAPAPIAVAPAAATTVIELDRENCLEHCEQVPDRYANQGRALQLTCDNKQPNVRLTGLAAGKYGLLARVRPGGNRRGAADWSVSVDHHRRAKGIFRRDGLPDDGWLWVSATPGEPLVQVTIRAGGDGELTLNCRGGPVLLDQLWLTSANDELPIDNAPRTPAGGARQ